MNLTLQQIAHALGGEIRGNQVLAPGPGHSPQDRSLAVKLADTPDGFVVHSHSPKDDPLVAKDHVRKQLGQPAWKPKPTYAKATVDKPKANGGEQRHIVAKYDYTDEDGKLLFQVVRYVPKGFAQRRPNGSDWLWGLGETRRVLYRLPELIKAVGDGKIVCIVEGEKAADALANIGVRATCSPMGAGKWRDEYSKYLAGANVVILPDNDSPGELHQTMVAKSLQGMAARVRVLRLAGLPDGGDVYDWLKAGGDAKQLAQAVKLADEAVGSDEARLEEAPQPSATGRLIVPSRQFVANYVAPEFLIDGIFQRRRVFSLTGKTGDCKTALKLYIAYLLATATPLGRREVEQCPVLYLAGENPDDVRARWLAMSDHFGFDVNAINVHFVEGVFTISKMLDRVAQEADEIGGFGAVMVDTSAAFFEGIEENDNVQLGNHARMLRKLTEIPGEPGDLVGCHPTKSGDLLIPRGGGAYLAEVDGNLTSKQISDGVIELHWCGKFRGSPPEPVLFEICSIRSDLVKDAKGRLIPSVTVQPIDDAKLDEIADSLASDEEQLILGLDATPGLSQAKIAEALGWVSAANVPLKSKVNRALGRLVSMKLADKDRRDKYHLTEKGKIEAQKLRNAA